MKQSALVTSYKKTGAGYRLETLGGPVIVTPARVWAEASRPSLVASQVRGDLHTHSNWSPDGRSTITQLIEAAVDRDYEYNGITDHAFGLRFGGLDPERLRRQRDEIEEARAQHSEIVVLHGAELNIGRDGSLDYNDEVLDWLDFAVAGMHSFLTLEKEEQTSRVLAAISHPRVNVIAHLTGRRIGIRPPVEFDFEAVFAAAARNNTALEVNGHLDRLDLPAPLIELAREHGVVFAADSDSHRLPELKNVENAVVLLQRAHVEPEHVINTWRSAELKRWLGRGG